MSQPEQPDFTGHDGIAARLDNAAGGVDEPALRAFTEIARLCGPATIDELADLLCRLRENAPARISAYPMVAFIRYGQAEGMVPLRGGAITAAGLGRYNVHTVFFDENTARWEGQNGRYGVTWDVARDELNRRAEREAQP